MFRQRRSDDLIDEDCKGHLPYLTSQGNETHVPPGEPGNEEGTINPDYWEECHGQAADDDDENGWPDDIHGYDVLNDDADPMLPPVISAK